MVSYIFRVLHSEDLLSEVLKVVEGGLSRDGVNQSKALAILHVQVSHCCELLLKTDRQVVRTQSGTSHGQKYVDRARSYCSCCVQDLQHTLLSIDLDLLQKQKK